MAQYKTGTVTISDGINDVYGSGTSWSVHATAGDLFRRKGGAVAYEIASVVTDTHLKLSANYVGSGESGAPYSITRDFTSRLTLPEISSGDIDWADNMTKALRLIDDNFIIKEDTGDPTTTIESTFCANTFDKTLKIYIDGDWRTIITWS